MLENKLKSNIENPGIWIGRHINSSSGRVASKRIHIRVIPPVFCNGKQVCCTNAYS